MSCASRFSRAEVGSEAGRSSLLEPCAPIGRGLHVTWRAFDRIMLGAACFPDGSALMQEKVVRSAHQFVDGGGDERRFSSKA